VVKGLAIFKEFFEAYADQYVLIGGTAASLTMEDAGLEFRATKDLDLVLIVEALSAEFGRRFWAFIEAGRYEIREASQTGKPILYRFQKPNDTTYPFMLELFCRTPDGLTLGEGSHLTPIPLAEAVSSLSAILLDDEYYAFILGGRRLMNGLTYVGEDRLIPLKACAWLELNARRANGESVDSGNIRKHLNDVLRLSQLLASTSSIPISGRIADDMRTFVTAVQGDASLNPKTVGLKATVAEICGRLSRAYGLETA